MDVYSELERIVNKYPWGDAQAAELARLRSSAPEMLDPQKQLLREQRHAHMSRYEVTQELNQRDRLLIQQHMREMQKNTNFLSSPSNAAVSVLKEQLILIDTFLSPASTEAAKQALWPSYELYTKDYIRMELLSACEFVANTEAKMTSPNSRQTQLQMMNDTDSIQSHYPSYMVSPEDRISSMLFSNSLSSEPQQVTIDSLLSIHAHESDTAIASINFEALEGISISNNGKLSNYDKEVYKAVCSLYAEGKNQYITLQMIYRTMTANANAKITQSSVERITETIDRARSLQLTVQAPNVKTTKGEEGLTLKAKLLEGRIVSKTINGKTVDFVLKISETPILFQYASSVDRVSRINAEILNTPINKTDNNLVLQGFLSSRIDIMKRDSNASNIIFYKDAYSYVLSENEVDDKKRTLKIRNNAKTILKYWKEKNHILNYSEFKEGHFCAGLRIIV